MRPALIAAFLALGAFAQQDAFQTIVRLLRHPRCMNCHSIGDYPRQGDDSHPHTMDIRRGPDGKGANAVKCSTCHQDQNIALPHAPPGALDWHLPSPEMPMIWGGLTDRQLCQLLTDPNRNGHRTIQQIVEHLSTPLVVWGWHTGEGRTPISMPLTQFEAKVKAWAAQGAPCPTEQR